MIDVITIFGTEIEFIYEVVYEEDNPNSSEEKISYKSLEKLVDQWNDVGWLRNFFKTFKRDFEEFYGPLNIKEAIRQTRKEALMLFSLLNDPDKKEELTELFKPLHNEEGEQIYELQSLKLKGSEYKSWLRVYALRFGDTFVITGGAIKLIKDMKPRPHTRKELIKLELVKAHIEKRNETRHHL